jgi:hypothetical protein
MVCHGRAVRRLFGGRPVAGWVCLPAMWKPGCMGDRTRPLVVPRMLPPDFGEGGNGVRGKPQIDPALASCDVADDDHCFTAGTQASGRQAPNYFFNHT